MEVAGQRLPQRAEGLQLRHAALLGQHGQRQHLVVQERARQVAQQGREGRRAAVRHLADVQEGEGFRSGALLRINKH